MHELNITKLSFHGPSSCMVDLSSAPSLLPTNFDRTLYPVKYYFTDLSLATKFDISSSSDARPWEAEFRHDVQECALKIDQLLTYVSYIMLPKVRWLRAILLDSTGRAKI